MEIRNRSELANVLGMEFKRYASNLENHYQLEPYLPYIEGAQAVNVTVRLFNGGISVEKGPDLDIYKAEISVLEGKVKDQEKEIKSLNILLEEQTFIEDHSPKLDEEPFVLDASMVNIEALKEEIENMPVESFTDEEPVVEKKKKRRTKKK